MKSPTKSPTEPGALVVPSHGNGKLRHGSRRGTNRGGTGRPPSTIRDRLRGSFDERVATLEDIADSNEESTADRIRAIDLLAKYGLGTLKEISTEDVAGRLRETVELIRRRLPEAEAEALLTEMRGVWQR